MSSIPSIISTTWQNATVANAIAAVSNVVAGVKAIAFRTLIQPVSSLAAAHPVIAAGVVVVGAALGLYLVFKSCTSGTTAQVKRKDSQDDIGSGQQLGLTQTSNTGPHFASAAGRASAPLRPKDGQESDGQPVAQSVQLPVATDLPAASAALAPSVFASSGFAPSVFQG